MRKALLVGLAVALVVSSLASPGLAGKKKRKSAKAERKVEHQYNLGSPGIPGVASACLASYYPQSGCVNIETTETEAYVTVKVEDASGNKPYTILAQNTDESTPSYEIFANFCGETQGPIPITPGLTLRVSTYAGSSPDCGGGATTGKITATLSNRP